MQYSHVALGGTFDLFHKGHKDFLFKSLGFADKVTIGVVSDKMARSLGKNPYHNFADRLRNVERFILSLNLEQKSIAVVQIDDLFGTTLKDQTIDAIAITNNTHVGAEIINAGRFKSKLKPLDVIKIDLSLASDNKPISSTRIREGLISPDGLAYFQHLFANTPSRLTNKLREQLSMPQGKLYKNLDDFFRDQGSDGNLISVGDQITFNLLKKNIVPLMSIVDFKIERHIKFRSLQGLGFPSGALHVITDNPPGGLTKSLIHSIHESFVDYTRKIIIVVRGEEDLSVLPAVLLSPLGHTILYGQRQKGLVGVHVTPHIKSRFLQLFDKFKKVD